MGEAEDRAELVAKLKALTTKKFGNANAWPELFTAYDADRDGTINATELELILADADVGNLFTRGSWVSGVIKGIDKGGEGTITRAELESAIASMPAPRAVQPGDDLTKLAKTKKASSSSPLMDQIIIGVVAALVVAVIMKKTRL